MVKKEELFCNLIVYFGVVWMAFEDDFISSKKSNMYASIHIFSHSVGQIGV